MNSDDYWSIDFRGVDSEQKALAIIDMTKRLGLATSAIPVDPGAFMTLYCDIDTLVALDEALAASEPRESTAAVVDSVRHSIARWVSSRSGLLEKLMYLNEGEVAAEVIAFLERDSREG